MNAGPDSTNYDKNLSMSHGDNTKKQLLINALTQVTTKVKTM